MPIKKDRETPLTESVISKHNCLIEIRDYLKHYDFKYPQDDYIPCWFSTIKRILSQAGYKF